MDTPDDLPLFPAWREAERLLLARGLTYGSLITDEELAELFGIAPPKSIGDVKRVELESLEQREALRASLLQNHRMMLVRTRSLGYTVVPPEQQTRVAMDLRVREAKHALTKLAREVSHVNLERLSDDQRKENSDAVAKIGALSIMFSKRTRALR